MDGSLVKSIFRTMCSHCWGREDATAKPCGLHGAGMTSGLATGSVGWGMRTKWKKHLPMTERSCHTFFVKCKLLIGWKEKCLHTNRFTLNMRDRGLVPDSRQCRQAERAAAGSRCQRTVLEPSSSSALCSGCRDDRSNLCMLKVSSTLWHCSEPEATFSKT